MGLMGLRVTILIRSDLADLVQIHADATGVSVSDVVDQALAAAEPWTDPGIDARNERLQRLAVRRAARLAKDPIPKVKEPTPLDVQLVDVKRVPCRNGGMCKGFMWRDSARCGCVADVQGIKRAR